MKFFILIFYTFGLFSVSQGGLFDWLKNTWDDLKKYNFEFWNKHPASRILYEYLDPNVDPCDNFFKFSCGKWIKTMKKKNGNSESFHYDSRMRSYDKFSDEFFERKHTNESKTISILIKLHEKCNELPKDKIFDCNAEIYKFGQYALSSVFLKKNIVKSEENNDYETVKSLIWLIKYHFELIIDEKKHIFDEKTRKSFKSKLNSMKFEKNFDEHDLSNVTSMEGCYDNIGINFNDNIENVRKAIKRYKKKSINEKDNLKSCKGKIFQPFKFMYKYVYINAWYDPNRNYFSVNSGALNEPSFSKYYPNAFNYGYLGSIIAHEILHAFDSINYNRPLKGDIKNKFNVTEKSIKNFGDRSDCFVKQYSMEKESITNRTINGSLTLSENIVDNGGIKLTHTAYMKYINTTGDKHEGVPAFEKFTEEQLFFISVGRSFCKYSSKDYLETVMDTDEHSPSEIRINMALSNYKPFSNAFNCPLNSKMNPEHRCELWKNRKQN
uniref:Phosphate-regulating neutral endopeptidase (inferred by orthology to a human protein) n=1 Tax=Strongyloides venezuelensis TaxID=75913 RepID=A0A0K0FP26_STRVS